MLLSNGLDSDQVWYYVNGHNVLIQRKVESFLCWSHIKIVLKMYGTYVLYVLLFKTTRSAGQDSHCFLYNTDQSYM